MSKELLNDSKVQSVILKLDKDKARELRFRMYLDDKRREGMNMKEAILQLFESSINPNEYSVTYSPSHKYEVEEIKTTEQNEKVSPTDFDMI